MKAIVNWRWMANGLFDMLREQNPSACPYDLFAMERKGPCTEGRGCSSMCWFHVFQNLQRRYAEELPDEVCDSEYFLRLHPEYPQRGDK